MANFSDEMEYEILSVVPMSEAALFEENTINSPLVFEDGRVVSIRVTTKYKYLSFSVTDVVTESLMDKDRTEVSFIFPANIYKVGGEWGILPLDFAFALDSGGYYQFSINEYD